MDSLKKGIKKKIGKHVEDDLLIQETTAEEPVYGPTILLESSFIVACIDRDDPNYKCTKSLLGFVEPHNCRFQMPLLVSAEVLSKLIHKGNTVSTSIKMYNDFINTLPGVLFIGSQPNFEEIVKRYKEAARKKLKDLQGNDFIIVTEGIIANSVILTCDYKMYQKAKTYHENIYFVATDSNKYKNDIPRFTTNFLIAIGAAKKKHGA